MPLPRLCSREEDAAIPVLVLTTLAYGFTGPISACPSFSHLSLHEFSLEQVIHRELHQHLVPEARACHPVGGEGLLGAMSQRRQFSVG
jgi:hypothetical protein